MELDPKLGLPVPYQPPPAVAGNGHIGSAELRRDLNHYIQMVRRRWWLIVVACAVSVGTTWWRVHDRVPTYSAEALIQQREQTSSMVVGMVNPFAGPSGGDFGSHAEIIRSRAVLLPAIDSLGLRLRLRGRQAERTRIVGPLEIGDDARFGPFILTKQGETLSLEAVRSGKEIATARLDEPIEGPGFRLILANPDAATEPIEFVIYSHQAAVLSLQRALRVEPGKGSSLLRLIYSDEDRRHAADVINAVARSFQRYRGRSAREEARRRQSVIAEELADLSDTIRVVSSLLEGYQQRQELVVDPAAEGSAIYSARLSTETEIRQYRFDIGLLENLLASLKSSGQSLGSMTRAAEIVPGGQALYTRLQQLEDERGRLTASRFGFTAQDPRVEALDSLIADVKNESLIATEQALVMTRSRLEETESRLGQLRYEGVALPGVNTELARYQQRVDAVNKMFDLLIGKYYEAQIAEGIEVGDIEIIDPASVPLWPDPSNTAFFLFAALMLGFVVGGAGIVTWGHLDPTIRHASDAERATRLEVVGEIPHLSARKARNGSEVALQGKEALRALRTNLRFAPGNLRTLGITSSEPNEGKTTASANLALSFLELGERVLLIDADLRRPTLHTTLDVDRSPGLSDVLKGRASLEDAVRRSKIAHGLHVLPAGDPLPGAPEMIASNGFVRLVEGLKSKWDIIIIDTPPVLAAADSVEVSRAVDGLLFVVRANHTSEDDLERAVGRLRRINAPLVGLVLNGVKKGAGTYEYYSYHYGEADEETGQRPRWAAMLGAGGK